MSRSSPPRSIAPTADPRTTDARSLVGRKLRALGRSPLQLSPAPKEMIAVLHATRKNNGPIAAKLAREKAAAEGSTSAKRGTYFGTYAKGSKQSAAPGASLSSASAKPIPSPPPTPPCRTIAQNTRGDATAIAAGARFWRAAGL